jgi:hypothetical protein
MPELAELALGIPEAAPLSALRFPPASLVDGPPNRSLLAFVHRYNQTAKPFNWKYTAADLKDLLCRISEHNKQDARRQN